jgi:hypothetical protein
MTHRGAPTPEQVEKALRAVAKLRQAGAMARLDRVPQVGEDIAPIGGWAPILDDAGNVIPDPPPSEPTDYHGPPC